MLVQCGDADFFRGIAFVAGVFYFFLVLFFFFFDVEVGILPDFFAHAGLVNGGGVDDDIVGVRLEPGAAQVGGCSLQSVEKQGGCFVLDLSGEQEAHDLHDGDLDGVGVLEYRQINRRADVHTWGGERDTLLLPSPMKVAKGVAADGRRSALGAVDLDVFAAVDVGMVGDGVTLPPGVDILES
jgi:hypothetical protein